MVSQPGHYICTACPSLKIAFSRVDNGEMQQAVRLYAIALRLVFFRCFQRTSKSISVNTGIMWKIQFQAYLFLKWVFVRSIEILLWINVDMRFIVYTCRTTFYCSVCTPEEQPLVLTRYLSEYLRGYLLSIRPVSAQQHPWLSHDLIPLTSPIQWWMFIRNFFHH